MSEAVQSDKGKKVLYYIFRAWRRHPQTGEIVWAKDHGLRAWRIPVYANKTGRR